MPPSSRWPVDQRGGTIDHRDEHVRGLVGLTFGEVNNGGGQAHIAAVALLLADLGERRTAAATRPMYTCVRSSRARTAAENACLPASIASHSFRGTERGQRLLEPTLREAQERARAWCTISSVPGSPPRIQRPPRSSHRWASSNRSSQSAAIAPVARAVTITWSFAQPCPSAILTGSWLRVATVVGTPCELDGCGVHALARDRTAERIGQLVELVYSRVDADGSLREARVAPGPRRTAVMLRYGRARGTSSGDPPRRGRDDEPLGCLIRERPANAARSSTATY